MPTRARVGELWLTCRGKQLPGGQGHGGGDKHTPCPQSPAAGPGPTHTCPRPSRREDGQLLAFWGQGSASPEPHWAARPGHCAPRWGCGCQERGGVGRVGCLGGAFKDCRVRRRRRAEEEPAERRGHTVPVTVPIVAPVDRLLYPRAGNRRPAAEPRPRMGGDHGQEAALRLAGPDDPQIRPHGQRVHGVSSPSSARQS